MAVRPQVRVGDQVYPALVSTDVAAAFMATTPNRLRERIGDPSFPVQPIKLGHRLKWPMLGLARLLGIEAEAIVPEAQAS